MANNRLYIGHPGEKVYLMISKGFGDGWNGIRNLEFLEKFIDKHGKYESDGGGQTKLILFTEYDKIFSTAMDEWEDFKKILGEKGGERDDEGRKV